jgi:hypothetical protein
MIPSRQRATILSFDSLMGSSGGVWTQPLLGRAADVWGYAPSYLMGAGISALAVPFLALSRRENAPADTLDLSELQSPADEEISIEKLRSAHPPAVVESSAGAQAARGC